MRSSLEILAFPDDHFLAYLVSLGYPADGPLRPLERLNRPMRSYIAAAGAVARRRLPLMHWPFGRGPEAAHRPPGQVWAQSHLLAKATQKVAMQSRKETNLWLKPRDGAEAAAV
jgi:hypothetical protein